MMAKIDPITQYILEDKEEEKELNIILEGYDLKCDECGRVVTIVKDGQGPLACCNKRMFVMGSQAEPGDVAGEQMDESEFIKNVRGIFGERGGPQGIKKTLKGEKVDPDFMVPYKSVNFTPDNQAEVQKEREGKRVNENVASADPTEKERDDIQKNLINILGGVVSTKAKSAEFTPYNQADVQNKEDAKKK